MSFFKKHFKLIIVVSLVIIASIFFVVKTQAAKNQNSSFNPKTETTITPTRQNIQNKVTLTGSIDASSKADLQFQTSGQLNWVGVKVGDKVKKHQAIASLNKEVLKKQLQADFNNYKTTASNFYDKTDDYKDSVITTEVRRILERNQNTLDNSVISYELQDLAIKYATLTSPINGVVTNVEQPNTGVNITPSSATFSIIDPTSIYFKAQVDQEDVTKIKVGDKATIQLDSFSDQTFDSEIIFISFTPVSGQTSTVYEVRFKLPSDNDDLKYRLGMDGDVSILLDEATNTITIPLDALHQEEEKPYVLVKNTDNDSFSKKYVSLGIETDDLVEVLEGIQENDQVIISK